MGTAQSLSTCFIGRRILWMRSPATELEPTAAWRIGIQEVSGRSPRKKGVQGWIPRKAMDRNILHQPSDTPEIMGSFYEAGWEIPRKWLKVNVCYSLGVCAEFSVSQLWWRRVQSSCGCPVLTLTIITTGLSHHHLAHTMRVNHT
jgi:hypothetical protein